MGTTLHLCCTKSTDSFLRALTHFFFNKRFMLIWENTLRFLLAGVSLTFVTVLAAGLRLSASE